MEYDDDDASGADYVGEDYVGDDDEEILGAIQARALARPRVQARGAVRGPVAAPRPTVQLASRKPRALRGYIGIGEATFTSTSGTLITLTVEPQRQFRPERLVIARRDGSAVTAGISSRVNAVFIGDQPQSPSVEQPAPTELFQPDATVSGVDFDVCSPGQKIQIQLSVSAAPAGTELIRLTLGMYGAMMRR